MRDFTIYGLKEEAKPAVEIEIPQLERKNRTRRVLDHENPRKRGKINHVKYN